MKKILNKMIPFLIIIIMNYFSQMKLMKSIFKNLRNIKIIIKKLIIKKLIIYDI